MKIDTNIFVTVLLALLTIEFLKAGVVQMLMDRSHRHNRELLKDMDGLIAKIEKESADETN